MHYSSLLQVYDGNGKNVLSSLLIHLRPDSSHDSQNDDAGATRCAAILPPRQIDFIDWKRLRVLVVSFSSARAHVNVLPHIDSPNLSHLLSLVELIGSRLEVLKLQLGAHSDHGKPLTATDRAAAVRTVARFLSNGAPELRELGPPGRLRAVGKCRRWPAVRHCLPTIEGVGCLHGTVR